MQKISHVRTTLAAALAALLFVGLAPPGASTAQQAGTLSVTPGMGAYVGGHDMTFRGQLGISGERRIGLQFNFGRAGDGWTDIVGFRSRTEGDGSFEFHYPAPAAFNIQYRVVGGGAATDPVKFFARSQDVVLRAVDSGQDGADNQVEAGRPFTIEVDTTPGPSDSQSWARLLRRPDLPPPAYPGRALTLQQRVDGDRWLTLDQTTSDQDGMGYFRSVTVDQPGQVVYRVRQEDWFEDGHEIGWFPSFPTYVDVAPAGTPTAPPAAPQHASGADDTVTLPAAGSGGASTTASQRYGWAPAIWDFAYELGESLTTRPARGVDRKGRWIDRATGTGRAVHYNGGLMLDSQRQNDDDVDDSFGTTEVELRGNAAKYGRWEVRMRAKSTETDDRDYRALIELVPSRKRHYLCGAQNITVADVTPHSNTVRIGVKSRKRSREWTRTQRRVAINDQSLAFAVEVSKRHISWFVEGKVIGTVKSRAAVSDVPMTLRLSLVGDSDQEMNRTQAQFDWIRGFDLDKGRKVRSGHGLKRGTHHSEC